MRRAVLAGVAAVVVVVIAIYLIAGRGSSVEAQVLVPRPAATIGSGEGAILVASNGELIKWSRRPEHLHLPTLPLTKPPKKGRLGGTALEQVEVLGAVPPALRRFLAASRYDSGVDVELTSGIELRFGDSSQAERKWRAAAAVLADKSITVLDYVDLRAPANPAVGGEGHSLPE